MYFRVFFVVVVVVVVVVVILMWGPNNFWAGPVYP